MVYCTAADVYRHAGINNTVIDENDLDYFIEEAQEEIDAMFNTCFETKTRTETRDGNGLRYLYSQYYPVQSISSMTIAGTSITTSYITIYSDTGKLYLEDSAEVTTFQNTDVQQVVFTYTYGENLDFSVDARAKLIKKLCSMMAAQQALISQIGGTYDDVTSYSLPEFSASKGEPYTNIREALERITRKLNLMMASDSFKSIGKNPYFA